VNCHWRDLVSSRWYPSLTTIVLLLGGCAGMQSALEPAGPQAARISHLWWLMCAICTAVFLLVMGFLLYAVFHTRRNASDAADPSDERRMIIAVGEAVALTVGILFVLLVVNVSAGRGLASLRTPDPLTIEVVGHQWWWEVHYVDPVPSQHVVTANEIHIPIGRPVALKLTSRDVIHSFWAPNLHGKRDLIPGHTTTMWFQADKSGVFRGQCAEFCGHQHALMAFLIIAEPPDQFAAWLEQQRQMAAQPADERQERGQEVFLSSPCLMCHSIRGTPAGGRLAPDLTHLASRRRIGSGTMPNTPGHLAGWILDPRHIKPGNKMPPTILAPDDLQALLAYLESLK
jgi:cytochrome c oxidase subunit II